MGLIEAFGTLDVLSEEEKKHLESIKNDDKAIADYLEEINFRERLGEMMINHKDKWYMKLLARLVVGKKKK